MLVLELNRENIEYDVYSLVKAFYPEEQVAVLMPESRQKNREELADTSPLLRSSERSHSDVPVSMPVLVIFE